MQQYEPAAVCQVVPGTRLGSCELLLAIARGGMAQVWAARQHGARGFNRLVAVKTVLPELAEPEFEEMFLEEARLAARIHHPNVCEIFELVEAGGVLALAMEWIHGDTLHALLEAARTRLDRRVAAQIVAHVANGLHAAHELRDECGVPLHIVHRDVSPHNVLISRDGHVKVTDFGVAKAIGGAREETQAGQVKGKPGYLSPEQARCEPLDRRSDIFSLGVLLYVATVNGHPFRQPGQGRRQQILNLLADRVTLPSAVAPDYPKALEAIVLKAIRHDPKERFSTAEELRRELSSWIMNTGGLITESDISHALIEHVGDAIEERGERLAQALVVSRERQSLALSAVAVAADAGAPGRPGATTGDPALPLAQVMELTLAPSSSATIRRGRSRLRWVLPMVAALSAGVSVLGFYSAAQRQVAKADARSLTVERPAAPAAGTCSGPACGADPRSSLRFADLPLADERGLPLAREPAEHAAPEPGAPSERPAPDGAARARQQQDRLRPGLVDAARAALAAPTRASAEPPGARPATAPAPARAARPAARAGDELSRPSARRAPDPVRIGPRETEL